MSVTLSTCPTPGAPSLFPPVRAGKGTSPSAAAAATDATQSTDNGRAKTAFMPGRSRNFSAPGTLNNISRGLGAREDKGTSRDGQKVRTNAAGRMTHRPTTQSGNEIVRRDVSEGDDDDEEDDEDDADDDGTGNGTSRVPYMNPGLKTYAFA